MFGGGKLMNGMVGLPSVAKLALVGIGIAALNDRLPQVVPYQKYAVAGLVAGAPGVIGVVAKDKVIG